MLFFCCYSCRIALRSFLKQLIESLNIRDLSISQGLPVTRQDIPRVFGLVDGDCSQIDSQLSQLVESLLRRWVWALDSTHPLPSFEDLYSLLVAVHQNANLELRPKASHLLADLTE